jgi:hypothetical protein
LDPITVDFPSSRKTMPSIPQKRFILAGYLSEHQNSG